MPSGDGEWECDECGHVIVGSADKPPKGRCPDCGESAADCYTFFAYDDDGYDDWDEDDGDDEE
jgi:rubrerythrin